MLGFHLFFHLCPFPVAGYNPGYHIQLPHLLSLHYAPVSLSLLCFSWLDNLVRNFLERPSPWVCIIILLWEIRVMEFGEEFHRGEVHFWSRCLMGYMSSAWLLLVMLTLITCLKLSLLHHFFVKILFFFPVHCSLETSH